MIENEDSILSQLESEPNNPPADVLKRVRVLFADDSPESKGLFKEVITRLDWDGVFVDNAMEIMDAINNILKAGLSLDAVVTAVSFVSGPKLTSITAVRELRKILPNVPVIFVSSYVTSIIREEVRRVHAEIVQKPFDVERLFVRLSQLIYWNRLVVKSEDYKGQDRRRNSINRTANFRRATDYTLSPPDRIAETLDKIQGDKIHERRKTSNTEQDRGSGNDN